MADDARLSTALPSHPKTRKLKKRLGADGCWSLVCLFLWVAGNRWDGNLAGMSDEDIELAAEWGGDSGAFVQAAAEVKFLDGETGGYAIHDWREHNPFAAARGMRIDAARKAAAARWEKVGSAERMPLACDSDAERIRSRDNRNAHHPTLPHPTTQDLSKKPRDGATAPVDWIEPAAWTGFIEMRKKIREPLTDRAVNLIVKELAKLRAGGYDIGEVLDQSTRNNWKDVYPLRGNGNGKYPGSGNRAERVQADTIQAVYDAKASLRADRVAS